MNDPFSRCQLRQRFLRPAVNPVELCMNAGIVEGFKDTVSEPIRLCFTNSHHAIPVQQGSDPVLAYALTKHAHLSHPCFAVPSPNGYHGMLLLDADKSQFSESFDNVGWKAQVPAEYTRERPFNQLVELVECMVFVNCPIIRSNIWNCFVYFNPSSWPQVPELELACLLIRKNSIVFILEGTL